MSDSAGSSPSSLSRSVTTEGTPSTSFSQPKPKRHVVSTTTSSMPRPLHLALGSVVGSSSSPTTPGSTSASPSPGLPHSSDHSSSVNGDNTVFAGPGTPGTSRAPSPSPLSPTITGLKRHSASSKRQSSISYIPTNGQSPPHASYGQRASVDGFTRSPLSTTTTFFGDVGKYSGAGLSRSSSLGRGAKTPRSSAFPERASLGLNGNQNSKETNLTTPSHLKDRPPVTLAEKHAELLHFIAQKESKCLELRSQLAVHEAELLQLKRKWERIVNRGFERSQNPASTPSSSALPLSASLLSTSPSSSAGLPPNYSGPSSAASSSYFTSLTPAANAPGAVVLEGIKGGVQGMSRLIAAGLESIVHVNGPSTPTTSSGYDIDASASNSHTPTPLRMDSAPSSKHWTNGSARGHGHSQKESQSSSSTTTSAASSATFASLSSTSTRTSATSASTDASVSGSWTSGDTTRKSATTSSASVVSGSSEPDVESEFGDFEDGRRTGTSLEQDNEQVLMVYDTGATPTMSPNPHFQRRKKLTEHVHVERLVLPTTNNNNNNNNNSQTDDVHLNANGNGIEKEQEEFDWDDGWDEPASEAQAKDNGSGSGSAGLRADGVASPRSASSLPLAPSVPGLGNLNMGAPTTQQMSYWVGSVGKKWDELKGSNRFTKSQKRASVLLLDMQNSIVSALTSPPATNVPLFGANSNLSPTTGPAPSPSPSPASFSSNASHSTLSPRAAASVHPRPKSATSLLDDSDDENSGANHLRAKLSSRMMAPIMVPDSLSPTAAQSKQALGGGAGKAKMTAASPVVSKDDEDEWNW